jgi:hypothetical protein
MTRTRVLVCISIIVIFITSWVISPGIHSSFSASASIIKPIENITSFELTGFASATAEERPMPESTSTPFPQEFLENARMTTGISIGAALLVLIVVGGTLWVLSRKDE